MENLKEAYDQADGIYEEYEALLWNLITDVKCDKSLLKLAGRLKEVQDWETNHSNKAI